MSSRIYFKLKNALHKQSVVFDGSVIQIGDIKRLIAEKQGLGSDGWQEINLYDPNSGVEYEDDGKVVARNTMVEVVRRPRLGGVVSGGMGMGAVPVVGSGVGGMRNMSEIGVGGVGGVAEGEGIGAEEALEAFAKGSAMGWQKEVKQAIVASKYRGRGRGLPPTDYRCPRCDVYGEHWIQECPTHGDPAYDRKRVRPPVGIPMTRLARSEEGGLVLPDGNTGTLVANEDAFAREVLGIGSLVATENNNLMNDGAQGVLEQDALHPDIKLKSTAEVLATAGMGGNATPSIPTTTHVGFAPFSISMMQVGDGPRLAGFNPAGTKMETDGKMEDKKMDSNDEKLFELMLCPALPRGPRDFLLEAYDREEVMGKEEFEKARKYWIRKMERKGEQRRSPSRGRESKGSRPSRSSLSPSRLESLQNPRMDRDRREDRDWRRDNRDRRREDRDRRYDDRERSDRRDRDRYDRRDDRRRNGPNNAVVFTIKNANDSRGHERSRDHNERREDRHRDRSSEDRRRNGRDRNNVNERDVGRGDDRRGERSEILLPQSAKTGRSSKPSKHAPIVWTEPEVDEIVDYGASSDDETGKHAAYNTKKPARGRNI